MVSLVTFADRYVVYSYSTSGSRPNLYLPLNYSKRYVKYILPQLETFETFFSSMSTFAFSHGPPLWEIVKR